MGKKVPKLHQILIHSFAYTNFTLLLGQKLRKSLFLGKIFAGMHFGYYGHFFGWVTLAFDPSNFIHRAYQFDKISFASATLDNTVSINSAQNFKASWIWEACSLAILSYTFLRLVWHNTSQVVPLEAKSSQKIDSTHPSSQEKLLD